MIITPKDAVRVVIERKAKTKAIRWYESRVEEWLFKSTLFTLGAAFVLAVLALVAGSDAARVLIAFANILLGLSFLILLFYQLASITPEVRRMRNPEKNLSSGILNDFNEDLDLIAELRATFSATHLRYAHARFSEGAAHMRSRVGLLVGAVEKVGIIPLALTAYLAWLKFRHEGLFNFGDLSWVGLFLAGFYLLLIRVMVVAQWMDRVALIFAEALRDKSDMVAPPGAREL